MSMYTATCSIYFVCVHVPETKGLSLEEIEMQFKLLKKENERTNGSRLEGPDNTDLLLTVGGDPGTV